MTTPPTPQSAQPRIRVGILGAAKIAPKALIAPAQRRSDVLVQCVAARDPERARAFAEAHGIPLAERDYASLIASSDIDLVYNALPPAGHAQWSIAALESGKAVLCEKPFALSSQQAREMVAASERTGNVLIEAFHYRFHEAMLRSLEIVRQSLGRLVEAELLFDAPIPYAPTELRWLAEQGGGALMDLGCYPIHAARTLTGEEPHVRSARSHMERGVDAMTEAELEFPSGLIATIRCSMTAPKVALGFRIRGERGTLSISNYIAPQWGCELKTTIDGVEHVETVGGPSSYEAQLEHVVRVLRGEERPVTGGNDAIANMLVIEKIRQVAAQNP